MGRTNEFTLVAKADYSEKLGCGIKIDNTLVHKTPVGVIASTAGEDIDGIITDIGVGGTGATLAVARLGDIVLAKLGGSVTVGATLSVDANAKFVTKTDGIGVAKALATGSANELIPVLIKTVPST